MGKQNFLYVSNYKLVLNLSKYLNVLKYIRYIQLTSSSKQLCVISSFYNIDLAYISRTISTPLS